MNYDKENTAINLNFGYLLIVMACLISIYNSYVLERAELGYNARKLAMEVRCGRLESFVLGKSKLGKRDRRDDYVHFRH
ncbi:hypothetical protein COX97_02290 [Candidatus Pacearchaeota archaeon CG_4_10_14_0_2_um_filter_05_32_18]|nr:MAG: hypothetical protein COX97_02290 [Candidatus Pacearchaeota archaeon CG_4_10_14_0_2_um_filter_05_32_18]